MRRSEILFHPASVSVFALLGVLGYAAWMRWRFPGGDLSNHYFYVLPIIVPFVAFLFSRAQRFRDATVLELSIDTLVVVTALMRMIGHVPFISGHALFLAYAIARPVSRLTRITAALVMLQVIYLKFFIWHDLVTPVTGIILGVIAAFIVWRHGSRSSAPGSLTPLPNNE
jgi:hypothetical protein